MAMMKIMGCFTRSKRGEEKGDGDSTILNKHKSMRVRMLDVRLSHSTWKKKKKLHPRHTSSLDVDGDNPSPLCCGDYADYDSVIN